MCITVKRIIKRTRTQRVGYKVVLKCGNGTYTSLLDARGRHVQDGYRRSVGNQLSYRAGKTVESPIPATAGIYLYKDKPPRRREHSERAVIKCVVPAGSTLLLGATTVCNVAFTASKVKVVGRVYK